MLGPTTEIIQAIEALPVEDRRILSAAITPEVALILSKVLGAEFGPLLLRGLNTGPPATTPAAMAPRMGPGPGGPGNPPRLPTGSIPTGAPGPGPTAQMPAGNPGSLNAIRIPPGAIRR